MIEPSTRIMLDVLARVNAVFRPLRVRSPHRETAVAELQREYRPNGVPYRPGGDAAERKANERTLAELSGAGLVTLKGDARRSRVWLSDDADEKLRSMVGLSGVVKTISMMAAIAEAEVRGWGYGGERAVYIPEVYLTGLAWQDPALRPQAENRILLLEEFASFGQVRGWLDTFYDTNCQWFYAIGPTGRQVLEHPPELRCDGSYNSAAADYYDQTFPEAEAWLSALRPRHENEVTIPFSAGLDAQAYREILPADHPLVALFERIENPVSPIRRKNRDPKTGRYTA